MVSSQNVSCFENGMEIYLQNTSLFKGKRPIFSLNSLTLSSVIEHCSKDLLYEV